MASSRQNQPDYGSFVQNQPHHPLPHIPPRTRLYRSVIACIILASILSITLGFTTLTIENVDCVKDYLFEASSPVNRWFSENMVWTHAFMILCGACMDIMTLIQIYRFGMYGTTWRLPITMSLFYGFRMIIQTLFKMRYPAGYLWEYPGFFSLTVPYSRTNDFFYSGHVGCCMIMFLEFKANHWHKFAIFSLSTLVLQFLLMIALRGHYTIDIIAGIIFGHYFFLIGERYSYLIDVKLLGLTLEERFPEMTLSCKQCQYPLLNVGLTPREYKESQEDEADEEVKENLLNDK